MSQPAFHLQKPAFHLQKPAFHIENNNVFNYLSCPKTFKTFKRLKNKQKDSYLCFFICG